MAKMYYSQEMANLQERTSRGRKPRTRWDLPNPTQRRKTKETSLVLCTRSKRQGHTIDKCWLSPTIPCIHCKNKGHAIVDCLKNPRRSRKCSIIYDRAIVTPSRTNDQPESSKMAKEERRRFFTL
ncbi:hypothetical protein O6H91_Y159600 [Diphasiastrum complanatum]|nr:hypothetical protein O6H91_Y159600 [Diphasiastrum complanatum]